MSQQAICGCLLGTAVGDALGLASEGLTPKRQLRMYPKTDKYHFFFGKGMVSDDTEHSCMVAQAMIVASGNKDVFLRSLAWRLRFWFLGLPAGVGLATLRSIIKLWLGIPASKSGTFSAGNGPAMRSAIIGVCYGNDYKKLHQWVTLCTQITHSDPKALHGALAIALAAYHASIGEISPDKYYSELVKLLSIDDCEFLQLISFAIDCVNHNTSVSGLIAEYKLEKGITGYMLHTVPMAIYCWLKYPNDYSQAITTIIRCGGDTDTTAAIVGAIVGSGVGKAGIPDKWLNNLWEWPRTVNWIESLAVDVDLVIQQGQKKRPPRLSVIGIILRNIFFLLVVLTHGFRRLLPPY